MQARPPAATHTAKVVLSSLVALFLVLFTVPVNLQAFLFGGASDVPLASLFMTWIRNQLVPLGWHLVIGLGNSGGISEQGGLGEPTGLFAGASLALTVIIGYPLIAYAVFERITPAKAERRRRMVYSLTSLVSIAFLAGVLLGIFFTAKFYIISLVPFFSTTPGLDAAGLYPLWLTVIPVLAIAFSLPFLLVASLWLRRTTVTGIMK